MNFIIVHLLLTCSAIRITKSSPPPKKNDYFQIDEFIKQLMTSDKFDELTDVIAEKSARKIKNLDSHMTSENDKDNNDNIKKKNASSEEMTNREEKANRDPDEHKERDRKSNDKPKNNDREKSRERDSRSNEKLRYDRERKRDNEPGSAERSNHDRERHRENNAKSNERTNHSNDESEARQKNENNRKETMFGKIDTQQFLKNHMTSKELELNFKHLTGELEKHRFNIKKSPKTDIDSDKEKKRSEHGENTRSIEQQDTRSDKHKNAPVKKSEDHNEEKNDSQELKITDHSSNENKEAHEQDTFHETDKNSEDNKQANKSDSPKKDRRQAEPKFNVHVSSEKPNPRMQKQESDTDELIKSLEALETSLEEENEENMSFEKKLTTNSAKEVVRMGVNRAQSDEISKVFGEDLSIPEEVPIVKSITPKKLPVRTENGKLFTFETSAEYAEYHENVAKHAQKKLYINTYKKKK